MPSAKEPPAAQSPGSSSPQKSPNRRPRRRFKWTRRFAFFCGWLACMALCLAALAYTLIRVLEENATPLANEAREYFAPDLPVHIGSITFPEPGVIELADVTLQLPEGDSPRGTVEKIRLEVDPQTMLSDPRAKSLSITRPDITVDSELLGLFAPDPNAPVKDDRTLDLSWLKIDELELTGGRIDVDMAGVPKGSVNLNFEASDIDFSRDGPLVSAHPQHLTLENLEIPSADEEDPLVSIDELAATFRLNKDFVSGAVATLDLKNPLVRFTPELKRMLFVPATAEEIDAGTAEGETAPGKKSAPMRWSVDQLTLENGFFQMAGFYDTPDLSFRHSGKFTGLTWADRDIPAAPSRGIPEPTKAGLTWPGRQMASATDLRIDARAVPSGGESDVGDPARILATADRVDLEMVPDDLFASGWIEDARAAGLTIHVGEEQVRRFFSAAPEDLSRLLLPTQDSRVAGAEPEPPAEEGKPWLARARHLDITDARVIVEADGFVEGLPSGTFTLNLHSAGEAGEDGDDVLYQMSATELSIFDPDSPGTPIVLGQEISAEFTAAGLQRDQRIDKVSFDHFDIRIGDEVNEMIAELSAAKDQLPGSGDGEPETEPGDDTPELLPPPDKSSAEREWTIGTLDLAETRFTLEDFIPGLPYLPLEINTSLSEVPLSGRTRGDERPQSLELTQLEIAAPFNSLLPVARMNSIVVHFTIPGLFRNEIERVEIKRPELFLGEPMIWYLTHFQKIAANNNPPAGDDRPEDAKVAAVTGDFDPCTGEGDGGDEGSEGAAAGVASDEGKIEALEGLADTRISGWQIKKIDASDGNLIIAPKGYPIGIVPFPFSGETDLTKGKLRLDLSVPREDYVFGELDLEFVGLYGDAYFNYPPDKNLKNFVQVFYVPTVHYKDYRVDDFFLSVTYNGDLIHGEFGGWAYAGYINGQFDIKIGEKYTWDAWLAGTDLMLSPLTEVISPDNFTLTGKASGTLVANGVGLIPGKIEGHLNTSGPCHMHVVGLDSAMKSLQEAEPKASPTITEAFLDPITNSISQASIAAFQHYDFTTGSANLNLVGREGSANILLAGPDGKRQMEVKFIDRTSPRPEEDQNEE